MGQLVILVSLGGGLDVGEDYPPGNESTYPTEREVRKIIDSKCPFLGDMLVLRLFQHT